MNFIKRLQFDLATAHGQLDLIDRNFNEFRRMLHGPKFTGTDLDGERKDWIATGDVLRWIEQCREDLQQIKEE